MRCETSDKNGTQKSSRKKLKRKVQVHLVDRLGKKRPKNSRKNPLDRKIGFIYKRIEKPRKHRIEQKDEVVYLSTQPEYPRDRLRRRTKNTLKKIPEEDEDEVVYLRTQPEHPRDKFRRKIKNKFKKEAEDEIVFLGTLPRHPRDRFRDRVKDKNGTNDKTDKKNYINRSSKTRTLYFVQLIV